VSAISGFCEKCNKFRKRHCDGNRNTCMSILFDTIEALQQENEQLKDAIKIYSESAKTWETGYNRLQQENGRLKEKSGNYMDAYDTAREIIGEQRKEIYNLQFGISLRELQQENKQLQAQLDEWKYEAKCHMDEVVARDKEIERLEAQVDTLSATVNMLAPDEIGKECRHIEALRKAREALEYCIDTLAPMAAVSHLNGQKGKMQEVCEEALATIDKAIGEKEDA
jgi:chromosome segregation ATPase